MPENTPQNQHHSPSENKVNNPNPFQQMFYTDANTNKSAVVDMFNQKQFTNIIPNNNYMNYPYNPNYTQQMMNSPEIYHPQVPYSNNTTPVVMNPNMMGQYYQMIPHPNMLPMPYYKDNNQYVHSFRTEQPMIYMGPDGNLYQMVNPNSSLMNGRRSPLNVIPDVMPKTIIQQPDSKAMSNSMMFRRDGSNQTLLNTPVQMLGKPEQRAHSSSLVYNTDMPKLNFKLPALRSKISEEDLKESEEKTKLPSLKELKQKINGVSTDTKKVTFEKDSKAFVKRTKTSARPLKFPCTQCEKRFHRQDALQTHMNIHLGLKPYKCDVCEKCFNAKQNMVRHRKRHDEK